MGPSVRRRGMRTIGTALALILLLAACGGDDGGADTSAVPAAVLDPILTDAAERTGDDDPTVVLAEAVEWPDTALGCPEEGFSYAQVITPGYRVVVEAGGETLDYRADEAGTFRVCEPDA